VVLSEDQGNFKLGKAALPDEAKAKIDELGPTNVSHHISDPTKLTVFDVGPASIPKDRHDALNTAGKAEEGKSLSKFIPHPPDKGFHFEVKV